MATRFYLPSSGSLPDGLASVTIGTGWEVTTGTTGLSAPRTKSNTALANGTARTKGNTVSNADRLDRIYVTEQLAAQTISGTYSTVIRTIQSNLALDAWLQVMIRVVSADASTVKATLHAGSTATVENASPLAENGEYSVTLATRVKSALALTSYACADGDRLSFEFGYRANGTNNTYTAALDYGDPTTTADFSLAGGTVAANVPWIEMSADLTFYTPPEPGEGGEIAFRSGSFGVGADNEFGDGMEAEVPKPSGLAVGDFLVAFATTSGDSPATTAITASGWDPTFYDDADTSGTRTNSAVLVKAATSGDVAGTGWTFTKISDVAGDQFLVHVAAFVNVDPADPIVAGPAMSEGPFSPTTSIATPALTIPGSGQAMLVCNWVAFWWTDLAGANRWSIPVQAGPPTAAIDYGAAWAQMLTGYLVVDAGTTAAAKVATAAANTSPAPRGHVLALRPAGGAGAPTPTNQFFHALAAG